MDIKEIAVGSVIMIGGVAFTVSEYGLSDVLSSDLKHYTEVSQTERPQYMKSVNAEFSSNFGGYAVQIEDYLYAGLVEFKSDPQHGTFIAIVTSDKKVPKKEILNFRKLVTEESVCGEEDIKMFTKKGWNYEFTAKDSTGFKIADIHCKAKGNNNTV